MAADMLMAIDLGMATGRVTAMAIGRYMAAIAELRHAAMRVAAIRAMLPAACMVVAAFTVVVEGSTAAEAVVFTAVVDPMAVAATDKVALSRRGSQLKTASPFLYLGMSSLGRRNRYRKSVIKLQRRGRSSTG